MRVSGWARVRLNFSIATGATGLLVAGHAIYGARAPVPPGLVSHSYRENGVGGWAAGAALVGITRP